MILTAKHHEALRSQSQAAGRQIDGGTSEWNLDTHQDSGPPVCTPDTRDVTLPLHALPSPLRRGGLLCQDVLLFISGQSALQETSHHLEVLVPPSGTIGKVSLLWYHLVGGVLWYHLVGESPVVPSGRSTLKPSGRSTLEPSGRGSTLVNLVGGVL